ncbi:Setd6, partial [Symbiodinium sp. CCMP2456]
MHGGMNGTGLRPRWKDNPRLPQLVGKPATDDLHTPCFVRHAYRHGTVTVGPPYRVTETMDKTSPAWCAAKMLDASIEKADWVRTYSKILKERDPKLGPDVNIRVASRSFSLPK